MTGSPAFLTFYVLSFAFLCDFRVRLRYSTLTYCYYIDTYVLLYVLLCIIADTSRVLLSISLGIFKRVDTSAI